MVQWSILSVLKEPEEKRLACVSINKGKEEEEYGRGRASRHTRPVRRWIIVRGRKRVPVVDPRDREAPGGLEEGAAVH